MTGPLCLEGERGRPPEDCSEPWGYADYLAAIADPKHEQKEEMPEWQVRSILKPSMRRQRQGR
jgi:hypothetical protein